MKILHISQFIAGGIASYLDEVVPWQLDALGQGNVRLLVPEDHLPHLRSVEKRHVCHFPSSRRGAGDLWRFARKALQTIKTERPDIVHLHSSFAGFAVRSYYLLRPRHRPRIVYCAHGWAFTMDISRSKKRVYALVERMLVMVTDIVINISRHEHREALQYGMSPEKMVMIHNGIKAAAPEPADTILFDPVVLNLLFIGRLDPQKGLPDLIAAMNLLHESPVHLHVLGANMVSGEGDSWSEYAHLSNVTFHGWQPRETVFAYMKACDAVVMPSRWEGFGLVAIEAMRLSKPMLASDVGALPELVVHGSTGFLFKPGQPSSIVSLLEHLNREELEQLGKNGRERFCSNFVADRMNEQILSAYKSVL